jgi:DNA-directed RNA polymerase specialized sigma subunit
LLSTKEKEIAERIFEANKGLITIWTQKYSLKDVYREMSVIYSVAFEGIIKGMITFDPSRGASINTHCGNHIRWKLLNDRGVQVGLSRVKFEQMGYQRLHDLSIDDHDFHLGYEVDYEEVLEKRNMSLTSEIRKFASTKLEGRILDLYLAGHEISSIHLNLRISINTVNRFFYRLKRKISKSEVLREHAARI